MKLYPKDNLVLMKQEIEHLKRQPQTDKNRKAIRDILKAMRDIRERDRINAFVDAVGGDWMDAYKF